MSTGTPTSTTRPSGSDACSMITVTVASATTAPAPRAVMSMALPMWAISEVPTLTTSPVATRLGSVPPSRLACHAVTCTVRYEALSQLVTANRCRMMPAAAWVRPSASSASDHAASPDMSLPASASTARPTAAGMSDCVTIQTIPSAAATHMVAACMRATQSR
jgi:hypothetical protein